MSALANFGMRYYCNVCNETITEAEYKYSMQHYGRALCRLHQRAPSTQKVYPKVAHKIYPDKVTTQQIKLSNALKERGIKHELEYWDGHKHVDIAILWAKLHIELDGSQHVLSSKQLTSDMERDKYSHEEGFYPIRIRNYDIDNHLDKIADNIADVSRRRYGKIQELEKSRGLFGLFKAGLKKLSEYSEEWEINI